MPEESTSKKEGGLTEIKSDRPVPRSPIADSLDIEFEPLTPDGVPLEHLDEKEEPRKPSNANKEKSPPPAKEEKNDNSKIPAPGKVIEFAQAAILQKLGEIGEKMNALEKGLAPGREAVEKMVEKFDSKIALDAHSKEMFSAMHSELKSYKDSALFDIFHKPFLKDLVLLYDDLGKLQKHGRQLTDKAAEKVAEMKEDFHHHANNIDNIMALVLEMLNRMDVEMIEETGVTIDKQYHKVVNTRKTSNADEDGKIAEIVNRGFRWRGKLLRHEEVIVYKHENA